MKYKGNSFCLEWRERHKYFNNATCAKLSHRLYQVGDEPERTGNELVELMVQDEARMGMTAFTNAG
jgi:hypothetical protein